MDIRLSITLGVVLFFLLVIIGILPMITSLFSKKLTMKLPKEFRKWIVNKTANAQYRVFLMTEACPPEVYDYVAQVIRPKKDIKVKILTRPIVLCRRDGKEKNKLVDLAFRKGASHIELRVSEELPNNHIKIWDDTAWYEDHHPAGSVQGFRKGIFTGDPAQVSMYYADFDWYWRRAKQKRPSCAAKPKSEIIN